MGRSKKYKTTDYKYISTKEFKNRGLFSGFFKSGSIIFKRNDEKTGEISYLMNNTEENPYIQFMFTITSRDSEEKQDFNYKVYFHKTPCTYGGFRYWFICPITGRKCTKLYLQGNGRFCDRVRLDLCYESQLESKRSRILSKVIGTREGDRLYETIKYPYRNGKPTRKRKKYLKKQATQFDVQKFHNYYR